MHASEVCRGCLLVEWVGNQLLMHACGAIMGTHVAVLAFVKGLLEGHWLRWGIY